MCRIWVRYGLVWISLFKELLKVRYDWWVEHNANVYVLNQEVMVLKPHWGWYTAHTIFVTIKSSRLLTTFLALTYWIEKCLRTYDYCIGKRFRYTICSFILNVHAYMFGEFFSIYDDVVVFRGYFLDQTSLWQECFHEKDYLNYRYHAKRFLYLCTIKKYLNSSSMFSKVEWSTHQNEARKPILIVHPGWICGKFTVLTLSDSINVWSCTIYP